MLRIVAVVLCLTSFCTGASALGISFSWSGGIQKWDGFYFSFEGEGFLYDSDGDGFITEADWPEISAHRPTSVVLGKTDYGAGQFASWYSTNVTAVNGSFWSFQIDTSELTIGQTFDVSGTVFIYITYATGTGGGGEGMVYSNYYTTGYVNPEPVPLPTAGLLLGSLLFGLPLVRKVRKG